MTWKQGGFSLLAVTVAMLVGAAPALATAPANDDFANAETITTTDPGPYFSYASLTADNTGATAEPGEPHHAGVGSGHSVWYRWTAWRSDYTYIFTVDCVDPLKSAVGVYTESIKVPALIGLAPVDGFDIQSSCGGYSIPAGYEPPPSSPSMTFFKATAGTTYYIAVDGRQGGDPVEGAFELIVQQGVACADAGAVRSGPPPDLCPPWPPYGPAEDPPEDSGIAHYPHLRCAAKAHRRAHHRRDRRNCVKSRRHHGHG